MKDRLFDEEDMTDDILNEMDDIDITERQKEETDDNDTQHGQQRNERKTATAMAAQTSADDGYSINENTNILKFLRTEVKFTENFRKRLNFALLSEDSKNIYTGYPIQEMKTSNSFIFNILSPEKKLAKIKTDDISICL